MTLILGLIGSPLGRALGLLLAAGIAAGMIWRSGYGAAQARCETASLRAELAAVKLDLTAADNAAATAGRQADALRDANAQRQKVIDDYVADLSAKPRDGCALDRGLIGRMRNIRK